MPRWALPHGRRGLADTSMKCGCCFIVPPVAGYGVPVSNGPAK